MKLCFSTLGCCDRSLEDILFLANSHGMDAIEIRGIDGVLENSDIQAFFDENKDSTNELLHKNKITPLVLGTSVCFHNADKFDKALKDGEAAIKIAEKFNIKYVRVFGDKLTEDRQACTERVALGLSLLCGLSDKVSVLLEVHGEFNTIEALTPVVKKMAGVKNFGLIWDIEHTHKVYGDGWNEFYQAFRHLIKHVHIKDYSDSQKKLCLIGEGNVPIKPIIEKLIKDGYGGYFSLEWEKKWHPELPDIEIALDSFLTTVNGGAI